MTVDQIHSTLRDDYNCSVISISERGYNLSCKLWCKQNNKLYRYTTRDGFIALFDELYKRVLKDLS